jgi:hypothetical protein
MNGAVTVAAGVLAGAGAGVLLRLPSGAMIGGLLGGLVAKGLLGLGVDEPIPALSVAAQIGVAYVLVRGADFAAIRSFPRLLPAALLYGLLLLGFTILMAWAFGRLCGLDFATSLFATSPGGLSGIAVVAQEAGADAPVAVLFNLCRILVILVLLPLLAARMGGGGP